MLCLCIRKSRNCPGLEELTCQESAILAKMHLWLLQAQSTQQDQTGQKKQGYYYSFPQHPEIRALTPKISAVARAETGSTAQNPTAKLTQYALEGIGDGSFKLHKGMKSDSLWS